MMPDARRKKSAGIIVWLFVSDSMIPEIKDRKISRRIIMETNNYTVLLVDDEEEVTQIIMKKLTGRGWAFQSSVPPATG